MMSNEPWWNMMSIQQNNRFYNTLQHIPWMGQLFASRRLGFETLFSWSCNRTEQSHLASFRPLYAQCMPFPCAFMCACTHTVAVSGSGSWTRATWASTCKLISHRMASLDGSLASLASFVLDVLDVLGFILLPKFSGHFSWCNSTRFGNNYSMEYD